MSAAVESAPLAMARRLVSLGFYPVDGAQSGPDWRQDLPCGGHLTISTNGHTDPERLAYCFFGYDAEGLLRHCEHWVSLDAALGLAAAITWFQETPAEEKALLDAVRDAGWTIRPAGHVLNARWFYAPDDGRNVGPFTHVEALVHFARLGIIPKAAAA